jgi:signal transduction histidine kinase
MRSTSGTVRVGDERDALPALPRWAYLQGMRVGRLQWAIGGFCAAIGILMLIVPHQFSGSAFAPLQPLLPWGGLLFVAAGGAMVLVAALIPRFPLIVATHLAASAALLLLAWLFLRSQSWTAVPLYSSLSGFTLLALLLADVHRRRPWNTSDGDLFSLAIGTATLLNGLVMLLLTEQFRAPIFDQIRPWLRWYGVAFCLGGLMLALGQLSPRAAGWPRRLACLLVGVCFLLYLVTVSIPNRLWTGIASYGGFGLVLLLLPLLEGRLHRIDPSSLRLRTGLVFVALATLPLILTTALTTERSEQIDRQQALDGAATLATITAQSVADYVELHQSAVRLLATEPNLLALGIEGQRARLRQVTRSHPEFYACSLFDSAGNGIARSDDVQPQRVAGLGLFEEVRRTNQPALEVRGSTSIQRPVLVFGAPLRFSDGAFAGMATCGLEAARLSALLEEIGTTASHQVYIVDGAGCVIAHPNDAVRHCDPVVGARPPALALRGGALPGKMEFRDGGENILAGYARVISLGWGVVVERPSSDALAGVRATREIAFITLAVVSGVALFAGIGAAYLLTQPLHTLGTAVSRLARGDSRAPLPHNSVREVSQLAETFDDLRRRLMASNAANARAVDALQQSESSYRELYQQAQAAVQVRDIFLSVASHELKTPLTSLMGYVELLRRRSAKGSNLSARDQRSLELIGDQAKRLNTLIGNLLDLSRLESGQLSIECERLDVVALTRSVIEEVLPTLEQHRIEACFPEAPLLVSGDALRLEQVLRNLLHNAVKYSPAGGTIVVEAAAHQGQAQIAVRDEGIGIPEEALPQLFSRYYRAPNVDARSISGLGLGLFVVREIVGMHGGEVRVTSREGQGSTFTVCLPLLAEGGSPSHPAPLARTAGEEEARQRRR